MRRNDSTTPRHWIIGILVAGAALFFAPLFLSLAENELLGTDFIYSLFESIGLAEPLGVIYEPVAAFLEGRLP